MTMRSMPGCVLVSGATYGLGLEIVYVLAAKGWPVVGFGLEDKQISSDATASVSKLQNTADPNAAPVRFMVADVTSETDVQRVVDTARSEFGRIYGLVNNAAIGPLGTVVDTPPDIWDHVHAVNLKGPYLTSRAVIPHMQAAGGGAIINVGSGAGWGKPNMAAYAASKGGLVALTAALALDHFHEHIRVNTVIPGGGGIVAGMSLGRVGGDVNALRQNALGNVAGRYTTGVDLAGAIAFLLSDDAQSISGTTVDVGCFAHQGAQPKTRPKDDGVPT